MAFRDYSLTPASNTALSDGTYVGPNMLRNKVRPAFQQIAADGKALANEVAEHIAAIAAGTTESDVITEIIRPNMARFGMREANSAAQNLTAIEDAIGEFGGGPHRLVIEVPSVGSYEIDDIAVEDANVGFVGHGSTFIGGQVIVAPSATRFSLKSLRFYHDTINAVLTLDSDYTIIDDVEIEKFGSGGGYMAVTEGTYGGVFNNMRFRGGNGMFIEAEASSFTAIHGIGRTVGGDDFLVVKARNQRSGDLYIQGFGENYGSCLSFGAEIGTLGGGVSATRPGRAENVRFDIVGRNCTLGVFLKPGAIDFGSVVPADNAAYDWEDGLCRNIKGRVQLTDKTGVRMARGLVISPARNALVDDWDIEVQGEGRFASTSDTECWAHIFEPDSTAYAAGGTGPGGTVGAGRLKVRGRDTYGGVDAAGPTPGNPPINGILIEKQNSAVGSMSGIHVEAEIDGTKGGGIVVGAGLNNAVYIDRLIGRNLSNAPLATQGGIHAESIVHAPGDNEIAMANTTYKPITLGAAGDVIGKRLTLDIEAAATTAQDRYRQLPYAAWLRKVTGVSASTVGTDATNNLSLEVRAVNGTRYDGTAINGSAMTTFSTATTTLTAETAFNFPAFATLGVTYDDRFLSAGAVLRARKSHGGGGQAFNGPIDIHYVQLSKPV